MKKNTKKNLICVLLSLLTIITYILIDGYGMIRNTLVFVKANGGRGSSTYFDPVLKENPIENFTSATPATLDAVLSDMVETLAARLIILAVVLFPIVFCAYRYLISFKKKDAPRIESLITYFRPVFGLLLFYYVFTIKTQFLHEPFTNYYSFGNWRFFFRIIAAFIVLAASVIDWPVFIRSLKSFPAAHPMVFMTTFVLFISVCSCMLVEFQIGSKMSMISYMLFFNILYWFIIQVFIGVITRNVKIGAFVSLALSYLIGIVNDVVFQFRGNYVMFGDLTVIRTALEVADKYTYKPNRWFWISLAILILCVAVTIVIKIPKHEKINAKEIAIRAGITVALAAGVIITFRNGLLYHQVFGVGWDYNTNVKYTGYIPYFMSNMNSIKKVELEGYNVELAENALAKAKSEKASYSSPNIIIIQNEAFADLSLPYDIKTNQDYMPFIHSLTKNTRKGYLDMSITGGPTANTEFEILMRSTLQFLPYGSVPYTQYIDSNLPSVVQVLKNQPKPYHTVAYHSYYTSGYRRSEVYSHFDFDEKVFDDTFRTARPQSDLIRGLVSDSADYRTLEAMFEDYRKKSDDPWFCFNVTIQNHGGYTPEYTPPEADNVYVTNFQATDSINRYLSLIKISDNAFKELIEYFSNCDEPTIIAMYGDHQPAFDNKALDVLNLHQNSGAVGMLYKYYVPYVIWANYDIEESDTLDKVDTMSTNFFASTVFKYAGIRLSDYDNYLLDLHERVPAITALGIWDEKGKYYPTPDATPYADQLATLEMIQYNLLFDDDKKLIKHFS